MGELRYSYLRLFPVVVVNQLADNSLLQFINFTLGQEEIVLPCIFKIIMLWGFSCNAWC